MNNQILRSILAIAALPIAAGIPLRAAEVVYENAKDALGLYNAEKVEYGDQIYLGGAGRIMTEFSFGYYADYDALQVFQERDFPLLRSRIYANDGVVLSQYYTAPGTVLYDSGWTTITSASKNNSTVRFAGLNVALPETVTWTVEFAGFEKSNESAGALFYRLPAVGSSFNFYWHRQSDDSWYPVALFDPADQTKKNNFNLQVKAIPEPGTLALLAVGGIAACWFARRRAA